MGRNSSAELGRAELTGFFEKPLGSKQREPPKAARVDAKSNLRDYFLPAAFRRAAQRAFIDSDNFLRPAAVRPRFLPAFFVLAVGALPPPRRAAQRAFIASESFRRPAAVSPLRRRGPFAAGALVVVVPFRRAHRARAAAANFARVAADIGRRPRRRRPPLRRPSPDEVLLDPPKRVESLFSSALICCLRESASVNF